jgi:hypothetical protein
MRSLVGLCFLALAALGVPASGANIDYEINFSGSGLLPTSGSFTYDPDPGVDTFSDFIVVWNGYTFDLTASANKPSAGLDGVPYCAQLSPAGAGTFAMLSGGCFGKPGVQTEFVANAAGPVAAFEFSTQNSGSGPPVKLYISSSVPAQNGNTANSSGVWTITQTPEPSSLTLLFAGLALVALGVRRRGASHSRRVQRKSESLQVSTSS